MLFEVWEIIQDFLSTGGQVLWLIFATTLALWTLILERGLFLKKEYPRLAKVVQDQWQGRDDKESWDAHQIRLAQISQAEQALMERIPLIKTLVSVCPLLGLLGTVTGMIAVFDVMAVTGTGNARLMASGISMATIPTMAGMVASLSGLYMGTWLEGKAKQETEKLSEKLVFQEIARNKECG